MKILVVGASGYIARHVVERLAHNGVEVIAFDWSVEEMVLDKSMEREKRWDCRALRVNAVVLTTNIPTGFA
jgi:nucleoside-diphosphate-sugar epimerase